jgi:Protein of unknown function (DUF4230)
MAKFKRAAGLILLIVVFGLGIVLGVRMGRLGGLGPTPKIYSTPVLLKEVQTLSELVTVKYVLEKVEGLEVPSQTVLGQALRSENRVLLLAHGIVTAGVDLKRLQANDLQVAGKQVSIQLPPPQILAAYLDETQTKVIDRQTGLLAPPSKDLEQTARQNALDDIRRAARMGGILKEADERARAQIAGLFLRLGFESVEFRPAHGESESLNLTPRETAGETRP